MWAGIGGPTGRYSVMSVICLSSIPIQPKPTVVSMIWGSTSPGGSGTFDLRWGMTRCENGLYSNLPVTNTKPSLGTFGCANARRLLGQASINDGFTNLPIAIQFCTGLSYTLESLAVLTLSQNSPQCSQDVTK